MRTIKNRIAIALAFILSTNLAYSQIGGISGSKLSAVCIDVVNAKTIEFEPSFVATKSSGYWNDRKELILNDSVSIFSNMYFRTTYGLNDRIEVGITFPVNLSLIQLGSKVIFYQNEWNGIAGAFGMNIPAGSKNYLKGEHSINNSTSLGLGIIYSADLFNNASIDFNIQTNKYLSNTNKLHEIDYLINFDFGYYLFQKQLQLIFGVSYAKNIYKNWNSHLLTVYPGFTLETGKNFIIVLSTPIDVTGRNSNNRVGLNLALTLTIN
jgi:hypothetical protein